MKRFLFTLSAFSLSVGALNASNADLVPTSGDEQQLGVSVPKSDPFLIPTHSTGGFGHVASPLPGEHQVDPFANVGEEAERLTVVVRVLGAAVTNAHEEGIQLQVPTSDSEQKDSLTPEEVGGKETGKNDSASDTEDAESSSNAEKKSTEASTTESEGERAPEAESSDKKSTEDDSVVTTDDVTAPVVVLVAEEQKVEGEAQPQTTDSHDQQEGMGEPQPTDRHDAEDEATA
jgi:hypothetical protein